MSKDGDCLTSKQPALWLDFPWGENFLLHPVETLFLSTFLLALITQDCEEPVFMFWKSCPCVWKGSCHLPKAERGRLLLQKLSLPKYVTLHLFCLTLGGNYKPSPPIVCLGPFKCPFCCQIHQLVLRGLVPRLKSPPHCLFCHVQWRWYVQKV